MPGHGAAPSTDEPRVRKPGREAATKRRHGNLIRLIFLVTWLPIPGLAQISAEFLADSGPVFDRPHDLVLSPDRSLLYVADLGHDVIQVVDPVSLLIIGTIGEGLLSAPHDVSFDAAGNLLVADSGNNRIAVFRLSGGTSATLLREIGGLASPEGVVEDADGRIFVANTGANQLVIIGKSGRRTVFDGGSAGDGKLDRPHDIDLGPNGSAYLTDPGNDRILVLDRNDRLHRSIAGSGFDFNEPKYLALDTAGRLYVADEHNSAVKVFDASLNPLLTIRHGRDHRDVLNRPEGVVVSGRRLWISDTYNNRLLSYDSGLPADTR